MGIILITLPQMPGKLYAEAFKTAWVQLAIVPIPGQLIIWPQ
jgi:hypothetical protein